MVAGARPDDPGQDRARGAHAPRGVLTPRAPALAPAFRRGAWTAAPVGLALLLDLGFDAKVAGAVASGALIAGFVAFDAPARTRALWQALAAPALGLAAAVGVLSSSSTIAAVLVMTVFATVAGFLVAVSARLAIAGTMAVLSLLIAQGLSVSTDDAVQALLLGTAGGLLQAFASLLAWVGDKQVEQTQFAAGLRAARDACARNLTTASHAFRHALRWGISLGLAVAIYRLADLQDHGYWIPLTVVFVLRPEADDTRARLAMRAVGTFAGLALATALAELLDALADPVVLTTAILTLAAALSYALLATRYALFTTTITLFVVLLADALGEDALEAAGQRALATAIGIALAATAFLAWPNRR